MKLKWFDILGNLNPQLLRELKSRYTFRNILAAVNISVIGQFLTYLTLRNRLPVLVNQAPEFHKYCTGSIVYETQRKCILDSFGNFIINWQFWWLNLFLFLSSIGIFVLLVGGAYLLVNDLVIEQRRGTLNFIRLSPQSPQSILIGKLLGVPSLLYLIAILAVPLHLKAGLAAQVPLDLILIFYAVLIGGCCFFYSAALLLSLVSSSAISSWLGSGTVLLFLWMTQASPTGTLIDWLFLLSPNQIIPYLTAATNLNFYPGLSIPAFNAWQWFYLPLGANAISLVISILLNYSLWVYWIWLALLRRFSNSSRTLLSKQQSYFLVTCFEVVLLGFITKLIEGIPVTDTWYDWRFLLVFNLIIFLFLIVSLTPSHQALKDWARYRKEPSQTRKIWQLLLLQDLMWSEKSPAVLAILFNLAIASTLLIPWIFLNLATSDQIPALLSLLICSNFIAVCAIATQILKLRITQNTALWITGTLVAVTVLPMIILSLITVNSAQLSMLWLFTPYAWVAIKSASQFSILLAIVVQYSILGLCAFQLIHDIKKNGESASKTLFNQHKIHNKW
ncbi:ABC transporter permease [Gloeocapsopsis sp. IPPAS B-1203]|uniref:ABC transporter permease n=1 Tax=Gloeocapsopsis sp. IPPAS B-1203 TaxID=2049454 RepID=UPI000C173F17|nr:ABC transporter permease [Gloeocapsopsis sp. IPPAS B-1203]PIG90464.1 ABC transporter permease [Gloeocapsopsis sp. IPPAS B-1203]